MKTSFQWAGLTLALATVSLGLSGLVQLSGAVLAFLAGGLFLWYGVATSDALAGRSQTSDSCRRVGWSRSMASKMPDTSGRLDTMTVLAGSSQIDSPLNEIIAYVFRDYIFSWHFKLSHSHSFPAEAEDSLHRLVASLAAKIQQVDWIPFLTTR